MLCVLMPAFISFVIGISSAVAEETALILVNADSSARAKASFQFERMSKRGGINKLTQVLKPMPLGRQSNMQMNRDAIYSSALVDISAGASVSFSNSGDR